MNAHANTTSFANTDIIIENVFSYDDVLKVSEFYKGYPLPCRVYFVFKPYY